MIYKPVAELLEIVIIATVTSVGGGLLNVPLSAWHHVGGICLAMFQC